MAVNVQRQNAYQASQSIGVFLNEFMDSDVTITRPDGTTFAPATAETESELRALGIAKRQFAAGAGLEDESGRRSAQPDPRYLYCI